MLHVSEHATLEEASEDLLQFILTPDNWVLLERLGQEPTRRPGVNPAYQRRVGALRICASVDVSEDLRTFLRVAFRGNELTPAKAADCLEDFLRGHLPLLPNTEWQVEIDARKWIHFIRPYTGPALRA